MSSVNNMSIPPTPQNIQNNFKRLQNDRLEALRLLEVFKAELKIIQSHKANLESEELENIMRDMADVVKNTTRTLDTWIKEFDVELLRVEEAVAGLNKNDIEEVKAAFRSFILEDTALSVKNVSMMFYDLNDILETVRNFNKDVSE